MPKNVVIMEGGKELRFADVSKLITDKAGGNDSWVPTDDRITRQKYISKNGIYYAKDDGIYGFSKLTVNIPGGAQGHTVPTASTLPYGVEVATTDPSQPMPTIPGTVGSSLIGIDPDTGLRSVATVQPDGTLEKKVIPSAIRVLIPPAKTTYISGEKIQYAGLVVELLDSDGNNFQDERFPEGIIPWSPVKNLLHPEYNLITPVEKASSSAIDDRTDIVIPYNGYEIGGPISYTSATLTNQTASVDNRLLIGYQKNSKGEMEGMRAAYLGDTPYVNVRYTWYNSFSGDEPKRGILFAVDGHFSFRQMYGPWYGGGAINKTQDGKEFSYFGYEYFDMSVVPVGASSTIKYSSSVDELKCLAWYILYGSGLTGSSIPVQWNSPYDNQTYEDKFNIEVRGNESASDEGGSSEGGSSEGGGGHSF